MEFEPGSLVDSLPDLIWILDSEFRAEFVNRRWSEYTGQHLDVARAHGWQTVIHPGDAAELMQTWTAITRSGAPGETEARMRRFDGEYRWFAFRFTTLSGGAGEMARWCAVATYADEKGYETTRTGPADRRIQRFADSLPTQVVFMTPSLELEFVNREALAYYGKSLDELQQWANSGAIHPDDLPDVHERLTRLQTQGGNYCSHTRMLRADGVYRWVRAQMVPTRDAHGNLVRYCSIQTDIDDLKRAETLLAGEVRVLEMVARGGSLSDILDALSRLVENLCPSCFCSVLLVAPNQEQFGSPRGLVGA